MQRYASTKLAAIYFTIGLGCLIILNTTPIPQDPEYHNFADQRQIIGIANFWNVISNLPFIIIGVIAVLKLVAGKMLTYPPILKLSYYVFFIGISMIGIGSAYYHLQPSNETLLWDRLPMTVSFMAFLAIITGEYISEQKGLKLLFPLVLVGASTVFYWHITEQAGHGDLRPYGLIQFAPMLIIPMILIMFPAKYTHSRYHWAILGAYLMAKIVETLDDHIFNLFAISGHTIKHLLAALGPYLLYLALKKRRRTFVDSHANE